MKRREFLKRSSFAGIAGLLSFQMMRAADGSLLNPIRGGLGTFRKTGGTMAWFLNKDAFVVIDSQFPDNAKLFLEEIDTIGKPCSSIDLLFNTHHHRDHTGGNSVLAPISSQHVAHQNCVLWQKKVSKEPEAEVCADTLVEKEWKTDISGDRIVARYYGNAHTSGDIVIHFEEANIAHVGDLVFHHHPPYIDRGAGASIQRWMQVLETLNREYNDDTVFIFGHAAEDKPVIGGRADLLQMRDFLNGLLEYASHSIQQGHSKEKLMETVRVPGFEHYFLESWSSAIPNALAVAYDELTES